MPRMSPAPLSSLADLHPGSRAARPQRQARRRKNKSGRSTKRERWRALQLSLLSFLRMPLSLSSIPVRP
jgi:hypothetical protein